MKNPYMPLWVDDFIRGTRLMQLEEQGLYIRMIMELWVTGNLPNDHKQLAKILGINSRTFTRVFKLISHKFVIQTELKPDSNGVETELITHSRVDEERLKLVSKSEINRVNGKKGGIAKANATNSLERKPSHTDTDTDIDLDTDLNISLLEDERDQDNPELDELLSPPDWSGPQDQSDPFFSEDKPLRKSDPAAASKLAAIAKEHYKSLEYISDLIPHIINLLHDVDPQTFEKAIMNAAQTENEDHAYRKNFKKFFDTAAKVKEVATSPVIKREIKETNNLDYIDEALKGSEES